MRFCRTAAEARSFALQRYRRVLGLTFFRAMSRHLIRRVPFVGLDYELVRSQCDRFRRGERIFIGEVWLARRRTWGLPLRSSTRSRRRATAPTGRGRPESARGERAGGVRRRWHFLRGHVWAVCARWFSVFEGLRVWLVCSSLLSCVS